MAPQFLMGSLLTKESENFPMKKKQSTKAGKRNKFPRIATAEQAEQARAWLSKSYAKERLCNQLEQNVPELIQLAKEGDKIAVSLLVLIASTTVGALNSLPPMLIRPHSRKLFAWPAFISRKRAGKLANEKLMDLLQLGEGSVFSKRGWQFAAPSTRAALNLLILDQLAGHTWPLPPLTTETKRVWFEASWKRLLKGGFKPEENKLLAPLGKSKATKKPKYCKELHKGTRDANVRAEIKARVWGCF
jgi:hypothetical protein